MKNLSCGIIAQPNSSFSVIYSNYCLRNGGFTTTAFSLRPRMSMQISVPTLLYSGLIYPIPIPILRVGDIVPEVTTPMAIPSVLYLSLIHI